MKQIIILSVLFTFAFGAKLNQYLPPRPETHNIQFQPPALPNSGNQPFSSSDLPEQPFGLPKAFEQSGQSSSPFGQFSQKTSPSNSYGQPAGTFGQLSQKHSIGGQSSSPFEQFSQKNTFNSNNGNPSRQYLTPNNKDTSGQSSNSIGQFQNPSSGSNVYNQDTFKGFEPKSEAQNAFGQFPNQRQGYNVPFTNGLNQPAGKFNGQFPSAQSNVGLQSAPVGLIRSEFNPDAGDGHYNYLYETENGITALEEGIEKNDGKSAQGGFSYTSPEGEQITIEYTADANGFVPKGSHVPEIPEAIAKSIELNKAAEARGEYNEGSYRDEYSDESNGNQGKAPFNSFQVPNAYGNGYQKSGPARINNFVDQGTFASEEKKQVSPIGQQNSFSSSYDQKINGVPGTLGHQSSPIPFGQKGIQQYNNKLQSPFGQQNNGPKTSFGQNNGYQYSAPGKTNFADQGTFASQQSQQATPFGQQNNVVSTSFGPQNEVPSTSFGHNNNVPTFGQQNNIPSISFVSQNKAPSTSFGHNNNVPTFGQQHNVPSTSFVAQNKVPTTSFGHNNNAPTFGQQNNGPELNFQNNQASGQYRTVQDSQGGYKY